LPGNSLDITAGITEKPNRMQARRLCYGAAKEVLQDVSEIDLLTLIVHLIIISLVVVGAMIVVKCEQVLRRFADHPGVVFYELEMT
jgi:hypothetical protein